ncbi:Protein CLEC-53 [Aphelenchoides avenae]|nr:Protein CLEC-53 [Aphelenchus avenae]
MTTAAGICETGSIQGLSDDDCYSYNEEASNWFGAEEACARDGGHLTSVVDAFENSFLGASWNSGSSGYWLGGSVGVTSAGKWTWTDGKPFRFTSWAKGQPSEGSGQHCLSMNLRTGLWSSTDCAKHLPSICKYKARTQQNTPSAVTCPSCEPRPTCPATRPPVVCPPPPPPTPAPCATGWTHLALTNKCYKRIDGAFTGPQAAATCATHGASLTSVHSYAENAFLTYFEPVGTSWIGLFLYHNKSWQWIDGSPVDYVNWDLLCCPYAKGIPNAFLMRHTGQWAFENSLWANTALCDGGCAALCSMPAKNP